MRKSLSLVFIAAVMAAVLLLSACGGDKPTTTTTKQPTTTTTQPTTTTTTTQPTTTTTTTQPTTTTTTTTTQPTTTTTTTTTTTQPTTTTTTTTTQPTTTTTDSGESLGEILGRLAGVNAVKYDMVTSGSGIPEITTRVWIEGNKMRTETSAQGQTTITIVDGDTNTMYMYFPDQNMAMEVTYEPEDSAIDEAQAVPDYNPTIIGHETYDGKLCLVVEYTVEGNTVTMWIWEEHGFPIKVVTVSSQGTFTAEYKNIVFGDIDDSLFELPEGVTIMTM
jgi:outer membrane lipoprotein-sorting protein